MFSKFLDAVTRPAQKIAASTGRQIEREFQREADRAVTRLAERAAKESSRRIVGLFAAVSPEETGPAATTGAGMMSGMFTPPPDDAA